MKLLEKKELLTDSEYKRVRSELMSTFKPIADEGFIRTLRKGDTGIGYTLETKLGIEENSISAPDLGLSELKAKRKNSNCTQTLFTFATRSQWQIDKMDLLNDYGISHHSGIELSAYNSVTKTPNKRGFYYVTTSDFLILKNKDREIIVWKWEDLEEKFNNKFPSCIKVFAESYGKGSDEHFHYNEAYIYRNVDITKFREFLENDLISIDLRIRTQKNRLSAKDKGTAFRISEKNMNELFKKERII
jgi:hypothetical protein